MSALPLDIKTDLISGLRRQGVSLDDAMYWFRREFIIDALIEHRGNTSHAAFALGVHRNTLQRDYRRLNIDAYEIRKANRKHGA
jgi:DNA-binding NtrC family response regulator